MGAAGDIAFSIRLAMPDVIYTCQLDLPALCFQILLQGYKAANGCPSPSFGMFNTDDSSVVLGITLDFDYSVLVRHSELT